MTFPTKGGRTCLKAGAATLLFVVLIGALPSNADAYGGFTRAKGSLYAKLSASTMMSNDFYDLAGNLNDSGQVFRQRAISLYAEYGVFEGFTAILDVPLLKANSYANTGTVYGIGDTSLELKYGLSYNRLHVAVSVAPSFPTGRSEAETTTNGGLGVVLPTGDGEFNVWSRLGVSYSLGFGGLDWLDGWASAGVGYNVRTAGFADQVGFGAELGTSWWQRVQLKVLMQGQLVPTPYDELGFSGFIYGDGTEFIAFGAGLAVLVPQSPVALTLDWQKPFFSQRNLYDGSVFAAGVSLELPQ